MSFSKNFCSKSPIIQVKDGLTGVGNSNDKMSLEDKKAVIMTYKKNVADWQKSGGTKSDYNNEHWNEVLSVHKATS